MRGNSIVARSESSRIVILLGQFSPLRGSPKGCMRCELESGLGPLSSSHLILVAKRLQAAFQPTPHTRSAVPQALRKKEKGFPNGITVREGSWRLTESGLHNYNSIVS